MTAASVTRAAGKYLAFARAAARRARAERTVVLGRTLFLGVILFLFSRIWDLIGATAALPGVGKRELVWYLALTEWGVLSTPPVFLAIEADVRSGDVACRLLRPVDYVTSQIAEAAGECLLRMAFVAPFAALFAYLLAGGLPADPRGLLLAVPLALQASLLSILCLAAIGLAAFWIVDTSPFFWLWQKLAFVLGGLLFPLELYPEWVQRLAHLTPFPLLCWAPGRMALGWAPDVAAASALSGVTWLAILVGLLAFESSRARARLTIDGG
jgi:viologen exporter family transport system permease protein